MINPTVLTGTTVTAVVKRLHRDVIMTSVIIGRAGIVAIISHTWGPRDRHTDLISMC